MRGLINRLHAILDIAKSAVRDAREDQQELALTLIVRLAERTITPTEARDDWRKRS